MQVEGYDIDIVVQGFPGKTVCHGGLGWSTVVLIRGHGKVAMIDTGNFNVRSLLIDGLKKHALKPTDLTDLLLTHAHWDHCVNWTLFPKARIVIGAHELAWAVKEPWGETPVPELYVRELQQWPTAHLAKDGEEVLPGITAHMAPGHTPGHLIYVSRAANATSSSPATPRKTGWNCRAARPTIPTTSRSAWPRSRRYGPCGAAVPAASSCPGTISR